MVVTQVFLEVDFYCSHCAADNQRQIFTTQLTQIASREPTKQRQLFSPFPSNGQFFLMLKIISILNYKFASCT